MYFDDTVIEQSTVRSLLLHLLPLLCLLSMANVLDRLNLGYAAPAMDPALRLTAAQLHCADDWFLAGFFAASLPSAWLLVRFGARNWIARIVVAWGVIAIAHAVVWNAASLDAVRLLLGIAEAGLMPAMILYLTTWMPPGHRGKPIAALVAAATVAGVLGAPAAGFLLVLGKAFGITNWRWLFLVEGLPALALGVHVPLELPETPADATWLTPAERHWLAAQQRHAAPAGTQFADGLLRLASWKLNAIRALIGLLSGGVAFWVPIAMRQAGFPGPLGSDIVVAVASILGAAGAVGVAIWADNRHRWGRALAGSLLLTAICLLIAAALPGAFVTVLLLAIAAGTLPSLLTLAWTLATGVAAGAAAAAAFPAMNMAGSFGVFAGGWWPALSGHAAAALAAGCCAAAWLAWRFDARRPAANPAPVVSMGE